MLMTVYIIIGICSLIGSFAFTTAMTAIVILTFMVLKLAGSDAILNSIVNKSHYERLRNITIFQTIFGFISFVFHAFTEFSTGGANFSSQMMANSGAGLGFLLAKASVLISFVLFFVFLYFCLDGIIKLSKNKAL